MEGKEVNTGTNPAEVKKNEATPLQPVRKRELSETQKAIISFETIANGAYMQKQLDTILGERKGTFTASLMEVFSNDTKLQLCDPKLVAQEAIKAACLDLSLNKQLGQAYIIPYGNTPTLVIGYKGLIKMAYRSGKYSCINVDVVYEGELKKRNKLTGELDIDGERTGDTVLGFFAYFRFKSGMSHTLYMTVKEMAHYAKLYVPTLKSMTEDYLINLIQAQAVNGPAGGIGWKGDAIGQAKKTVLKQLLTKWGDLSVTDMQYLADDDVPGAEQERDELNSAPKKSFDASAYAEAEEIVEEDNPFK